MSMSSCASMGASGTGIEAAAVCREVRRALPTWSRLDTARSREEAATFLAVLDAACPTGGR